MTKSSDQPRFNGVRKALLWLGVIALALFPYPLWW